MSAAFDSPALDELEELYVELGDDFVNDPRVKALMEDEACAQVVHAMAALDPALEELPVPESGPAGTIDVTEEEKPVQAPTTFTPNWKPNASSQLSDLVRSEQTKLESGPEQQVGVATPRTNGHALPHVTTQARATPFAPANVSAPAWQVPTPPKRSKPAWFWALLLGAPVTAAAMGAMVMMTFMVSQPQGQVSPPSVVNGTQVAANGEDLTEVTPPTPELPEETKGVSAPEDAPEVAEAPKDKQGLKGNKRRRRGNRRGKDNEKDDDRRPDFEGRLVTADIVEGVKKNAGGLASCLKRARSRGEIVPGKYRFILDWKIRPNGTVANPRLKAPSAALNTSVPACFAAAMKEDWRFKTSAQGAPVKNFPLPLTIR